MTIIVSFFLEPHFWKNHDVHKTNHSHGEQQKGFISTLSVVSYHVVYICVKVSIIMSKCSFQWVLFEKTAKKYPKKGKTKEKE